MRRIGCAKIDVGRMPGGFPVQVPYLFWLKIIPTQKISCAINKQKLNNFKEKS
jgi:hypothetical protein